MYVMLDLKKYIGVIFHDASEWCKIWRKLNCGLENKALKVGTQNWIFCGVLLSQVENVWASNLQLCVMTMKKDAKIEKELTSSKLTWGI